MSRPVSYEYLGSYFRTAGLLLAMCAGVLCPSAHVLAPLIPWLIALMLFLTSLDLHVSAVSFTGIAWRVLAANLVIAFLGFFLLLPAGHTLALVAFMTGISPTAISAPVVTGFLEGRVDEVVASVLLTNLFMAIMLPFVLPLIAGAGSGISTLGTLRSILLVVCVPLFLSRCVQILPGGVRRTLEMTKPLSFWIWLAALFVVTATSSRVVQTDPSVSSGLLPAIAVISFLVCAISFAVGALIGGPARRREGSQALGQKNNSFTIWLALTFISPVVALGPTLYVIYHNLYNSLQILAFEKKRRCAD